MRNQFDDEGVSTETSRIQIETEQIIVYELDKQSELTIEEVQEDDDEYIDIEVLNDAQSSNDDLSVDLHIKYLLKGLKSLPHHFDASKPWILFWTTHSLDLLNHTFTATQKSNTLASCQCLESGAFGGGKSQLPHLATTYASLSVISIINAPEAHTLLDPARLYTWIMSLKTHDGSFRMHKGGSYCVMVIATLLGIVTYKLLEGMEEYIISCQGYEGGLSSTPGLEAHGGYTYCGLAALVLIKESKLKLVINDKNLKPFNIEKLKRWTILRQMETEGGFSGRTHKLVDGCYSFWVGATIPIIDLYFTNQNNIRFPSMFDRSAMQRYLMRCCQGDGGGLRDKPGKSVDYYHTCYCLSGLSCSQFDYEIGNEGVRVSSQFSDLPIV